MPYQTKITFHGGAGSVTGSNFLVETGAKKILVDCGFFQGCNTCDEKSRNSFAYDPASIDYLIVTHAHLDHIGRIPKLVKDGFKGVIYSTPPTKDLTDLALSDSLGILRGEARHDGKPVIYGEEDIKKTLSLWKTLPYHQEVSLQDEVSFSLKDAGHILGSSMIEFSRNGKKLVFTGDLGNSPAPLLRDTEEINDADFLVMESVYGDRNHESREKRYDMLEDIIEQTVFKKGLLLIPAFSIERTQDILYEIEHMVEQKQILSLPVFVDSPLAIKVTEVYKRYTDYFNQDAKSRVNAPGEIFSFKQLHLTQGRRDSDEIEKTPNPKIIIAGSGMSEGGRVLGHEKHNLADPLTTLLIVGYQSPLSLGRLLRDGAKKVTISGEEVVVRAQIKEITSYSAHKDSDALLRFVEKGVDSLKKVFVVMGEMKSSTFLTQRLRDYLGVDAVAPKEGDSVEIDF